jgi:hypothetical protein
MKREKGKKIKGYQSNKMNSNMNKLLNDIYMSDVIDSLRLID